MWSSLSVESISTNKGYVCVTKKKKGEGGDCLGAETEDVLWVNHGKEEP